MTREEWLTALKGWHRPSGPIGMVPLAGLRPGTDEPMGRPATRLILWYSMALPDFPGKWRLISALQRGLAARESGERLVERHGLLWQLEPTDYPHYDLFWFGYKERWETLHALSNLAMGATLLDVGANFGYYAIFLASVLGPNATAHAFEPNPPTFERLRTNVALNQCSNITIHPFGLSDVEGETAIQTRAGNSGGAQLVEGRGVKVRALDAVVAEAALERVDFIKIDVEGFEDRVLLGGAQSINRFRPMILVELNPPNAKRERIAQLLRDWGYLLHVARRSRLVPLERLPTGEDYVNAFAVHRDSPVKTSV